MKEKGRRYSKGEGINTRDQEIKEILQESRYKKEGCSGSLRISYAERLVVTD